jgi:lysophospholipase L1-like esterase
MRARGRLLSCLVTMVIALAGFLTAGALPAAATPSTVQYVALGDSYAAGTAMPGCSPSLIGYSVQLDDAESRIDLTANAACSGATTSEVADQLSALDRHTRLVTLTVGGADLDVARVLTACSNPSTPEMVAECSREIGRALALLGDCPEEESSLDSSLTDLYADVADAAPGARIVVTGYPLLFQPPADTDTDPVAQIKRGINEATTRLNCVIERAVTATQATDVNIYYVDVTEEFAGHGIGGAELPPFINAVGGEAFHPTVDGYRAYAEAIRTKLPGGWLDKKKSLV